MMTQDHIKKVLSEIHQRVPVALRKAVAIEVDASPTVLMVMQQAVGMESIAPEKREQIQKLIDAGEFSKKKVVEDPKIAKMIDEFIAREIKKEVKKGNLPTKKILKQILENEKRDNKSN